MHRVRLVAVALAVALAVGLLVPAAATTTTDCRYPAQVLSLSRWKMTLPIGAAESPTEVMQPELDAYAVSPWFKVAASCDAVRFRAPVNGVTTVGSSYPRSELREMSDDGSGTANWSSTSGRHTLVITQSIDRLPAGKPHMVAGQIHDSVDDVAGFRLEGRNLYVTNGDDAHHKLVTSRYRLGTKFEGKFAVSEGKVKVYYNGALQTVISASFSNAYFKAGAYTQANCDNSSPCDDTNFGQVSIYDLILRHG